MCKIYLVVILLLHTQNTVTLYVHRSISLTPEVLRQVADTTGVPFQPLLDPIMVLRVSGTEKNIEVRKYLKDHMTKLNWTVETDPFQDNTPNGEVNFENIIATLNPDTPRRLVMACHFDSKLITDFTFIGATDSAVPCAMLLHLASSLEDKLSAHKDSPVHNVTLQFIFFDGEEAVRDWTDSDSLYGSRHLAAMWEKKPFTSPANPDITNTLHRITMMILLDLVGAKNPTFPNYFESTSHWHKTLREIENSLRSQGIWSGNSGQGHFFRGDTSFDRGIQDDHIPFAKRDVEILHLIVDPFPSVWHTEKDNKEALDLPTIENLNRIFRVFVTRYLHLTEGKIDDAPTNRHHELSLANASRNCFAVVPLLLLLFGCISTLLASIG